MLSEDQQYALNELQNFSKSNDSDTIVITGGPGSGKTFLMQHYIDFLNRWGYSYCLCAPTHKAKVVLERSTKEPVVTLHKLLSMAPDLEIFKLDFKDLKFKCGAETEIPEQGIVIVDECSMITDDFYDLLYEKVTALNSKLVFIGDSKQIRGVNNQDISKIFKCKNIINLNVNHRQGEGSGLHELIQSLREKPKSKFTPITSDNGSLFVYNDVKTFLTNALIEFKDAVLKKDPSAIKLIAYHNNRVNGLNNVVRKHLWKDEEEYHVGEFIIGKKSFMFDNHNFYNSFDYIITKVIPIMVPINNYKSLPGYKLYLYDSKVGVEKPIMILSRNIPQEEFLKLAKEIDAIRVEAIMMGYMNKARSKEMWIKYYGIVNSFVSPIDICFEGRVIVSQGFDYGYAVTVYKIQGETLQTVYIDMKDILCCREVDIIREMQHVAISRTKKDAHILTY